MFILLAQEYSHLTEIRNISDTSVYMLCDETELLTSAIIIIILFKGYVCYRFSQGIIIIMDTHIQKICQTSMND